MSLSMRSRPSAAVAGAATIASLLLAACGSGSSKPAAATAASASGAGVVHLSMLTGLTGPDEPYYQTLIKQFDSTHPDIQVTMTVEPWATLGQKLPEAWATGSGPDLATPGEGPDDIYPFLKTNSAVSLSSDVGTGPGQIDAAAFPSSVKTAFTASNQLYAVPANFATLVLYYNKTMFAAAGISSPPTTEADFIADAKKLTLTTSGKVTQYGLSLADNDTIQMWPILMWMEGGDILQPNGCAAINDAASVQALTTWSQLVTKDHISPVGQSGSDADTLFASQKAAMEMNGPWAYSGYEADKINVGIAQIPVGSAGPATLASTVPIMIEKSSKHIKQAEEFLSWYTDKAAQTEFSQASGFPPARTDLGSALASNPVVSVFNSAIPDARLYLANQPNGTEIDTNVITPLLEQITTGADVQTSANAAAKQINQLTGCKS